MSIDVELPRAVTVELFANLDNVRHWQPSLLGREHVSGTPSRAGAKARLRHRAGRGREITVLETIIEHRLPEVLEATYETAGFWNRIANRFEALGPDRTRWTVELEVRCTGLMKLLSMLVPKLFRYQTLRSMERFKLFAEMQHAQRAKSVA